MSAGFPCLLMGIQERVVMCSVAERDWTNERHYYCTPTIARFSDLAVPLLLATAIPTQSRRNYLSYMCAADGAAGMWNFCRAAARIDVLILSICFQPFWTPIGFFTYQNLIKKSKRTRKGVDNDNDHTRGEGDGFSLPPWGVGVLGEMRSSQQGDMLQHYYTIAVRARQSGKLHKTFPTASYETQAQEKASMRCHCTKKRYGDFNGMDFLLASKSCTRNIQGTKLGVMGGWGVF